MNWSRGSRIISKRILCRLQKDLYHLPEDPVSYPRKYYVISKRILCHLQECPVSSPGVSRVIFKRILCHLQEDPMSSPGVSRVIFKRILCHLQKDPASSSRGSCVLSKSVPCQLQEDPVSSPRGSWVIYQNNFVHPLWIPASPPDTGKAGNHEQPFTPLPLLILTFIIAAEIKKLTCPVLMSPIRAKNLEF